jgi:hypothetical protein
MAVELEIRDGDPWWMSPDLWVVPGSDPEGTAGSPVAGETNYVWAEVRNNGSSSVTDATVRFYWADPSVGFDRTTAHLIGTAYVSLAPSEAAEVLCLTPWIPTVVNDGHECILAEIFHASDPLPATAVFDVPTDRHVAQKNLSVVEALDPMGFFALPFVVENNQRLSRDFRLIVRQGPVASLKRVARRLSLPDLGGEGKATEVRITSERCPTPRSGGGAPGGEHALQLGGHRKVGRTLSGQVSHGPVLLHVEQREGDRPVGGLSVLVLPRTASTPTKPSDRRRTSDLEARGGQTS